VKQIGLNPRSSHQTWLIWVVRTCFTINEKQIGLNPRSSHQAQLIQVVGTCYWYKL
jgi:hypothetical protein